MKSWALGRLGLGQLLVSAVTTQPGPHPLMGRGALGRRPSIAPAGAIQVKLQNVTANCLSSCKVKVPVVGLQENSGSGKLHLAMSVNLNAEL